jgi:EAL domain-containing protein (putative c-di-GMP-specific phosphodiesterase class I)
MERASRRRYARLMDARSIGNLARESTRSGGGARYDRLLGELGRLAQRVAEAPDLRTIYRALHDYAIATTPTCGIFVALYDPQRQQRVCVYTAGDGEEDDVAELPPMPMSGSPQSLAIATGEPVVTDDLRGALVGKPVIDIGSERNPDVTRSSVAIPLIVLGRTIGAFEVQSYELAAYREEHVVALRMAASLAAIATENVSRASGPGLSATSDEATVRRIRETIDGRAFRSVFQPIVELQSGAVVGYEALTRFTDGSPPNQVFQDAATVGVGLELELATIAAALEASAPLPANAWLDINVSPALLLAGGPLAGILADWGWEVVLELTEHLAIADYHAVRAAVADLGPNVRLAVDDAGAGYASFRHIVELMPSFVKIDRAIIGGIPADPARQALVAGLRHFSLQVGCTLIAEGVETDDEIQTLRTIGVTLAQGYHLGRPAAADDLVRPRAPGTRRRRHAAAGKTA